MIAAALAGALALVIAGLALAPPSRALHEVAGGRVVAAVADSPGPAQASRSDHATHHYLYVFPDGEMDVYDIDHGHRLVQRLPLPGIVGIRGVAASPRTHTLFISYGGDFGPQSQGSIVAYDLLSDQELWRRTYDRGVDSLAVDGRGRDLYVPDGENSSDGVWMVVRTSDGSVMRLIRGGLGPHNTVLGPSGRHVYLGGRSSPYLDVASTATGRIVRRVGPLRPGVRPFTVNGAETLAFTTATGALGFQVSSLRTGRVLYTMGFGPHFGYDPSTYPSSAPSHGISLSPNERQLWVMDGPNDEVHVFDVSGLPFRAPRRIADIPLQHPLSGSEAGCEYDCTRDGWLLHSRSGCYVYVGDAGEVISTVTRREVAFLPALSNTRKYLEIDWRGGRVVASTGRQGLGYRHHGTSSRAPRCR
jgi:DNA-binding beta-propeller fold protein YncE